MSTNKHCHVIVNPLIAAGTMSSVRIKDKATQPLDVKGARSLFEHGIPRQREPSPAPNQLKVGKSTLANVSSFKQKFEQFTSPREATPRLPRRAASHDPAADNGVTPRSRQNSLPGNRAEKYWQQARAVLKDATKTSPSAEPQKKTELAKTHASSIHDRINQFKKEDSVDKNNDKSPKLGQKSLNEIKANFMTNKSTPTEHQTTPRQTLTNNQKQDSKLTQDKTGDKTKGNNAKKDSQLDKSKTLPAETGKPHEGRGKANRAGGNGIKLTGNHVIRDDKSARLFMQELMAVIDEGEQHVPMRQLISLFERMHAENSDMRETIERLRSQLNDSELETINRTLENKLAETRGQLADARQQIDEISVFRRALEQSEERCEELEELNQQHLQEIESLRLEMDEMRDQFHDDEVHESLILQQRLDDMARSLRIIHFRLKKADSRLAEADREKEALLEEVRLLQGGAFTDEEIRRMQALEGDLQSAKEVSVELHAQLDQSEQRRERLEAESARLREQVKAIGLENDRLRNNIEHLKSQVSVNKRS